MNHKLKSFKNCYNETILLSKCAICGSKKSKFKKNKKQAGY